MIHREREVPAGLASFFLDTALDVAMVMVVLLGGGGGVGSIQILYSGGVLLLGVVTTGDISMRFPLRPSLLL